MNGTPVPRARSGHTCRTTRRFARRAAACAALLALLAAPACLAAAAPQAGAAAVSGDELWRQVYDGPGGFSDLANDLVLAPGGEAVYVTGSLMPEGAVKSDLGLIKYRPNGSRAWLRTYDGAAHGNDEGKALACDRAGNVYVGGFTDTATGEDFLLVKNDAAGRRKWARTYDGAAHGNERIAALAVDAKGNVYAAGRSDGSGSSWDAALVKWTPSGKRAWVRRYNGAGNLADEFRALVIDTSHGRIYAGGIATVGEFTKGWLLIRYSVRGKRVWTKVFSALDRIADSSSLALTPGGAVLQAGSYGKTPVLPPRAVLGQWTAAGALAWSDGMTGTGQDYFADIAVDRHGAIFAVGIGWNPSGNTDALLCRFTPGGTLDNFVTIGGADYDDRFSAVACDAAGNVYATGAWGTELYGADYLTEKFSNDLEVRWQRRTREHDVAWSDVPQAIAVRTGANAGVYVTGRGSQTAVTWDWLTIKYKP